MICHVVLYRLKGGVTQQQRDQLVRDARQRLAKLPGLRNLRVGLNLAPADGSFDIGMYMEFADAAALQRYRVDPQHQAFVHECVDPVVANTERFDFEAG
jgi:hypothetical protein